MCPFEYYYVSAHTYIISYFHPHTNFHKCLKKYLAYFDCLFRSKLTYSNNIFLIKNH